MQDVEYNTIGITHPDNPRTENKKAFTLASASTLKEAKLDMLANSELGWDCYIEKVVFDVEANYELISVVVPLKEVHK